MTTGNTSENPFILIATTTGLWLYEDNKVELLVSQTNIRGVGGFGDRKYCYATVTANKINTYKGEIRGAGPTLMSRPTENVVGNVWGMVCTSVGSCVLAFNDSIGNRLFIALYSDTSWTNIPTNKFSVVNTTFYNQLVVVGGKVLYIKDNVTAFARFNQEDMTPAAGPFVTEDQVELFVSYGRFFYIDSPTSPNLYARGASGGWYVINVTASNPGWIEQTSPASTSENLGTRDFYAFKPNNYFSTQRCVLFENTGQFKLVQQGTFGPPLYAAENPALDTIQPFPSGTTALRVKNIGASGTVAFFGNNGLAIYVPNIGQITTYEVDVTGALPQVPVYPGIVSELEPFSVAQEAKIKPFVDMTLSTVVSTITVSCPGVTFEMGDATGWSSQVTGDTIEITRGNGVSDEPTAVLRDLGVQIPSSLTTNVSASITANAFAAVFPITLATNERVTACSIASDGLAAGVAICSGSRAQLAGTTARIVYFRYQAKAWNEYHTLTLPADSGIILDLAVQDADISFYFAGSDTPPTWNLYSYSVVEAAVTPTTGFTFTNLSVYYLAQANSFGVMFIVSDANGTTGAVGRVLRIGNTVTLSNTISVTGVVSRPVQNNQSNITTFWYNGLTEYIMFPVGLASSNIALTTANVNQLDPGTAVNAIVSPGTNVVCNGRSENSKYYYAANASGNISRRFCGGSVFQDQAQWVEWAVYAGTATMTQLEVLDAADTKFLAVFEDNGSYSLNELTVVPGTPNTLTVKQIFTTTANVQILKQSSIWYQVTSHLHPHQP